MARHCWIAAVGAIVCLGIAMPAGASAAHRVRYCHGLLVGRTGDVYAASGTSCAGARRVGVRFLHHRRLPAGWRCRGRRRNTGRSQFVFTCTASGRRSIRVYDAIYAD